MVDETPSGTQYRATHKMKQMFCPECGEVAGGEVNLGSGPTYWCDSEDCDTRWDPVDVDNCIECGDPVTGSDVICHTCWTEE